MVRPTERERVIEGMRILDNINQRSNGEPVDVPTDIGEPSLAWSFILVILAFLVAIGGA